MSATVLNKSVQTRAARARVCTARLQTRAAVFGPRRPVSSPYLAVCSRACRRIMAVVGAPAHFPCK